MPTRRSAALDILVNNAGVEIREPFVDVEEQHFDLVLGVNFKGAFFAAQAAAKLMIAAGDGGRIVNVSSGSTRTSPSCTTAPTPPPRVVCACLRARYLQELAPYGITVNDIAPGAIATPIDERTLGDGELLHALQDVIPSGRVGEPDEVAGVAVFLASDEAAFVTGSTYYIDGGVAPLEQGTV